MLSVLVVLSFLLRAPAFAQHDTMAVAAKPGVRHVRISLMTVGPGDKIWEAFGHTCIRVIDSARTGKGHDLIFNYGTFDNYEHNFLAKMAEGTLLYYLSVFPYDFFVNVFVEKGRSIEEQVFVLNDQDRTNLVNNLEVNTLPQNKYYQYDYFTDNCSTRVYDMIAKTLGKGFVPGKSIPDNKGISYYDGSYEFYRYRHWERVGVGLVFQKWMSRPVRSDEMMFLPPHLSKMIAGATLNGLPFSEPTGILAGQKIIQPEKPNGPFILTAFIALLTIAGLSFRSLRYLGRFMTFAVPVITGLLGCILLYAWLGTEHKSSADNFNLLWALPTNLLFPFLGRRTRAGYGLAAAVLIATAMIFHMLRVFVMPLFELTPLLLALVFIYTYVYRTSGKK